ncbi:MAG TPA: pyroglutamyl-peptidase I, partial [Chloroflexi bacterium]|nr:pyroglutamyl-peptidase I [Chloroflexota bacterium]
GNQVSDQSIVPDGPAAYFTTLPVRAMLERLKADGIPAALSLSAGTYLCNQIFYVLRHHLETWEMNIPAGFIHLPDLPEQAARKEASIPSMSLTTMILGVRAVLELIAGS